MFLQFLRQLDHLFRSYCGFVSGLGGRKKGKLRATLILDQRLLETAVSLDDIHHIVDDPVFQPQNHIQIPKTDVCIDDHGPPFPDVITMTSLIVLPPISISFNYWFGHPWCFSDLIRKALPGLPGK